MTSELEEAASLAADDDGMVALTYVVILVAGTGYNSYTLVSKHQRAVMFRLMYLVEL